MSWWRVRALAVKALLLTATLALLGLQFGPHIAALVRAWAGM